MRKLRHVMAIILVIASCLVVGFFFLEQLSQVGSWKFFAVLIALLIFTVFAALVIRETFIIDRGNK